MSLIYIIILDHVMFTIATSAYMSLIYIIILDHVMFTIATSAICP